MEASAGLVAGSHNRNEFVVIHGHEEPKPLNTLSGHVCQICGEDVGLNTDGELFVACNECGFPVCRPCYEYERREGNQSCPQCNTRYKRQKGSPRVEGDDDEEDVDDIEHEFNVETQLRNRQQITEAMLHGRMSYGRGPDDENSQIGHNPELPPQIPVLANGHSVVSGEIPTSYYADNQLLANPAMLKRVHPSSEPGSGRIIMDPNRDIGSYGFGNVSWKERGDGYKSKENKSGQLDMTEGRYQYNGGFGPNEPEDYIDPDMPMYEREGEPSMLAPVDLFVSTVDPLKEPPLVTANTVLSILSVDYPVDNVSCYVSDDGASMLTFESLSETSEFARKWVPFCKKFDIEPRAPEIYFSQKIDYLKDKFQPTFVKERRAMKREYEEFKVRINRLVAKASKVPKEGWTMQDGTPWPGNNTRDHPGMIQVFLGHSGGLDTEGNELPRLVYVSREKRPGFQHHKKAGAMNALVRVSAVLTNAPFMLNLDCDHYINNSKAIREAMCFMMDPQVGRKVCYVQFPQRFDGIDRNDRYANRNTVFFDINMKGLDGIQGPVYVGTGCMFRRQALYGYGPPKGPKRPKMVTCDCLPCCGPRKKSPKKNSSKKSAGIPAPAYNLDGIEEGVEGYDDERALLMSQLDFEKKFGQSSAFVQSTLMENGGVPQTANPAELLKEAIHVISCGYEDKTEWGKELGWIYGSVTEDILTGFKMHTRGWRSIYCMPKRAAFKGSAPINLSDRLNQVLRWALGSVEIFMSRHCPIWYGYGGGLKWLERFAYINTIVYPFTSLPLIAYCTLPAVSLLTGKFVIPQISTFASLFFIALFISIFATGILEMRWSGVSIEEWWRNEQFWVIGGVSAHFFAVIQGLLKVLAGIDTNFTVTAKASDDGEFGELYAFKWTTLLIPPTTLLVINLVGVVVGVADAINNGFQSWGPLLGKLFFAFWVIVHLYPFLKGLMGRQNRTPTIVVIWSILLASVFSLFWVRIDPFLSKVKGPDTKQCGINC
eukprot:PITA_21006